jgi:hypothetical protein
MMRRRLVVPRRLGVDARMRLPQAPPIGRICLWLAGCYGVVWLLWHLVHLGLVGTWGG